MTKIKYYKKKSEALNNLKENCKIYYDISINKYYIVEYNRMEKIKLSLSKILSKILFKEVKLK